MIERVIVLPETSCCFWIKNDEEKVWGIQGLLSKEIYNCYTESQFTHVVPCLKYKYQDMKNLLTTQLSNLDVSSEYIDYFPFDLIIARGIRWQSDCWTGLAARWIRDGYKISRTIELAIKSAYGCEKQFMQEIKSCYTYNYEYPNFNIQTYLSIYEEKVVNFNKEKVLWL